MRRIRVLFATPGNALFRRVQDLLFARSEVDFIPHAAGDGCVLPAVRRARPDILLVDGEFGERAIRFIHRVSALDCQTRSLLIHSEPTELRLAHVLRHGGAGCLPATCNAFELIRAICAVHHGELWASRKALADVLQLMRITIPVGPPNELGAGLSRREREIVGWMRQGMTNKQIGRVLGISDMTVKTHAHNIFHKLEVSGRRVLASVPTLDH